MSIYKIKTIVQKKINFKFRRDIIIYVIKNKKYNTYSIFCILEVLPVYLNINKIFLYQ